MASVVAVPVLRNRRISHVALSASSMKVLTPNQRACRKYYATHKESERVRRITKRFVDLDATRKWERQYLAGWRKANPERWRALVKRHSLKKRYGLTADDIEVMLIRQDGRCGICESFPTGKLGWHIDHDHGTKRVRGLLCGRCNMGLGHFEDSPVRLEAAANYLRRFGA